MHRLVHTALEAADAAARVHRAHAGRIRTEDARDKGISDFVSQVDLEAQRVIVARIREDFPDHRILAEEDDGPGGGGAEPDGGRGEPGDVGRERDGAAGPAASGPADPDDAGPTWVVDPLDGTSNYLHGHPAYASSVGVVQHGRPVAGAVVAAATDERWWAGRGEGAYRNGERIRVSATADLQLALVGTGFPFKQPERLAEYLAQFERILPVTAGVRRCGSAALDLCYLAQGSLDAFWEIHLSAWDIAAGLCVLAEAGGVARSFEGPGPDALRGGSVLAANSPELLDALGARVRAGTAYENAPSRRD